MDMQIEWEKNFRMGQLNTPSITRIMFFNIEFSLA